MVPEGNPPLQPLSPFLIFQLLYRLRNEGPKSTPRVTSTNKAIIITASASIPAVILVLFSDIVQIIEAKAFKKEGVTSCLCPHCDNGVGSWFPGVESVAIRTVARL